MLNFFKIMDIIGESNTNIQLASKISQKALLHRKQTDIYIHEFLMNNYREEVNLEKLADLVHMAKGSLLPFFQNEYGADNI